MQAPGHMSRISPGVLLLLAAATYYGIKAPCNDTCNGEHLIL